MRASVQEQLQTFLNVVNVMVRCRSRLVAVRIQPYVLVSDPKADIIWLVCIRLAASAALQPDQPEDRISAAPGRWTLKHQLQSNPNEANRSQSPRTKIR